MASLFTGIEAFEAGIPAFAVTWLDDRPLDRRIDRQSDHRRLAPVGFDIES